MKPCENEDGTPKEGICMTSMDCDLCQALHEKTPYPEMKDYHGGGTILNKDVNK